MPKVFDWNGYRFYFYSNEGDPLEPPHIHVRKGRDDAKFWLQPEGGGRVQPVLSAPRAIAADCCY